MSTVLPDWYRAQARIPKTSAHPTRLFIVDELSRGERCLRELTAAMGGEMPTVSRHLSLLRIVGILDTEKRGLPVFYGLRGTCVLSHFTRIQTVRVHSKK